MLIITRTAQISKNNLLVESNQLQFFKRKLKVMTSQGIDRLFENLLSVSLVCVNKHANCKRLKINPLLIALSEQKSVGLNVEDSF